MTRLLILGTDDLLISNFYCFSSGGIQLSFTGHNMLSVGFPLMMMYIKYQDDNDNTKQIGCFDPADGSCYKQVRVFTQQAKYQEVNDDTGGSNSPRGG